jgi:hypothetical protein
MKKKAAAPTTEATTKSTSSGTIVTPTGSKKRKPTKWALCLYYLTQRPLFALEALRLYGDTCLNTSISDLTKKHGLIFHKEWITHHHQNGGTTEFMRYTLAQECREQAAALLKPFGLEVKP